MQKSRGPYLGATHHLGTKNETLLGVQKFKEEKIMNSADQVSLRIWPEYCCLGRCVLLAKLNYHMESFD